MRNNRRNARRGGQDRTLEIMSKYEPVLGDGATGGFFSGERASGMVSKAEDHFRDMQRLREQKRMQNQKNIDLLGAGAADSDAAVDAVRRTGGDAVINFGDASLRKPATTSSNKADDINTPNEDGTTKGVYSPRKPYVDTVQRNALTRELDRIKRGADAYRGNFKESRNPTPEQIYLGDDGPHRAQKFRTEEIERFQTASRMLETELKYGTNPLSQERAYDIMGEALKGDLKLDSSVGWKEGIENESFWDQKQIEAFSNYRERYYDKVDKNKKTRAESAFKKSFKKAKAALGVDDRTLKAIEAISKGEIRDKLLNDLGIDQEDWKTYTKLSKSSKTASE